MTGGNSIPFQTTWNEEQEIELKRLWEEEGLSAGQIAAQTGRTRNAVIGKVHRMGLLKRRDVGQPNRVTSRTLGEIRPKRARLPRKDGVANFNVRPGGIRMPPTPPEKLKPEDIKPLHGTGIPMLESERHHCKAVVKVGNPATKELAYYCGQPRMDGESYCEPHCSVYYRQPVLR